MLNPIYLLHGKGGSPAGTVSLLEAALRPLLPAAEFIRPRMPHTDPEVLAEDSLAHCPALDIPQGALVVGISLGGTVACAFQERERPDLHVIAISSPTWADGVRVEQRAKRRIVIYSTLDNVIQGRTAGWPQLAEAHDLAWLTHQTDAHLEPLSKAVAEYANGIGVSF